MFHRADFFFIPLFVIAGMFSVQAYALNPVAARELRARALSPYPARELTAYGPRPIPAKELAFSSAIKPIAAKELPIHLLPPAMARELKPPVPLQENRYAAGNTVSTPARVTIAAGSKPVVADEMVSAPQKPYVPRSHNPEDYDPASY